MPIIKKLLFYFEPNQLLLYHHFLPVGPLASALGPIVLQSSRKMFMTLLIKFPLLQRIVSEKFLTCKGDYAK